MSNERKDWMQEEIETLRARVAELEAGMGEPVAWEHREHHKFATRFSSHKLLADDIPLFRTPPTVAAALKKAAELESGGPKTYKEMLIETRQLLTKEKADHADTMIKLNNLTARLEAQEASKPVAWVMFCSDGSYEGPIMDCDRRMEWRRESAAWTPLYTTPQPTPTVKAAVAAAIRKAAEVVRKFADECHFSNPTADDLREVAKEIEALYGNH